MNKDLGKTYKAFIENKKLLDSVARKLAIKSWQVEDLKQIVYLNFIKYYPQYNSSKSTIANWIFTNVRYRALRDWHNTSFNFVRLPAYVTEIQRRYKKGELTGEFNKDKKALDNAGLRKVSKNNYNFIMSNYCIPERLDNTIKISDYEILDTLLYNNTEEEQLTEPELQMDDKLFYNKVDFFLNLLPKQQKEIIKLFYGINKPKTYSVKEISLLLHLPEEKIISQKGSAITKLKTLSKRKKQSFKNV